MSKITERENRLLDRFLPRRKLLRGLWILVLCFIWGNSMIPVKQSEDMSIIVMEKANELVGQGNEGGFSLPSIRKLAHVLEFAAFSALTYVNMIPHSKQGYWNLFFLGFGVAFLDETIQLFPEGRGSYVIDVWIDLIGVVLGILFMTLIRYFYEKQGGRGFSVSTLW